jgi:hypothetical protein
VVLGWAQEVTPHTQLQSSQQAGERQGEGAAIR